MFKKIAFAGVGLALLASPLLASADTLSDLQAQITALLAQLKTLQEQVSVSTQTSTSGTNTTVSQASCVDLTASMGPDDTDTNTNGDVTKLQTFLAGQGSSIYPEARITGYFGPATTRAVQRWQSAQGLITSGDPDSTGYGYVGPKTRKAMGCNQTTTTTTGNTSTAAASCTFNGSSFTSGSSFTAYQAASVAAGSQCVAETRTCANGTLSGSYTNSTCTVAAAGAPTCTPTAPDTAVIGQTLTLSWTSTGATSLSGGITKDGAVVLPVASTVVNGSTPYTPSAAGTYLWTINVGGPGGTNTCTKTITVAAPASCTFNGSAVSNGYSVTAYQSSSVAYGQTCVSQQRTCANGTLSGSYTNSTCTVAAAGAPTCTLTAPDTAVAGQPLTLTWTSAGATSLSGSIAKGGTVVFGGGTSPLSGTSQYTPSVAGTYVWTANVGGAGGTNTCTKTITVAAAGAPTCTPTAPDTAVIGQTLTLSWTSTGATSLSGGITKDGAVVLPVASTVVNGSTPYTPSAAGTYLWTINVGGPGGTNTCTKTITVAAATSANAADPNANLASALTALESALKALISKLGQ